jgi:hypothetical protein
MPAWPVRTYCLRFAPMCVLRELYLYNMQLGGQAPTFLGQLKALSYVPAASPLAHRRSLLLRPLVGDGGSRPSS